ncbi:MAG: glutaminyl-peptide cyclotransferase [Gemmatimonadaceae bacterium]|nr:glutaminyl-peptide cyclotransferase [Gemmatimonadaceae bacterium]
MHLRSGLLRTTPVLAALLGAHACDRLRGETVPPPFEVIARYPHDTAAYTQGLVFENGALYESTGRYGYSQVRRVDLRTGSARRTARLGDDRFGEGLALLDGRLWLLTWESRVGYVLDAATLAVVDSFAVAGEGWGLTTDGRSLIMSDGSDSLRVLSPMTRQVERVVHVTRDGSPLSKLNELEFVDGEVLANVYESDWVARIDPATGVVRALIDLADLYPRDQRRPGDDVMNGIARGPQPGTLLVTGKMWPWLWHIRLKPAAQR